MLALAALVGCGAPQVRGPEPAAARARLEDGARRRPPPRAPPELAELTSAERARLDEALVNRRVLAMVAFRLRGERVVLVADRYAGPPWYRMVGRPSEPGVFVEQPVVPAPPGAPYQRVLRVLRVDEAGVTSLLLRPITRARWDWELFDMDEDGARELVVRVETSESRREMWAAGVWDGTARARLRLSLEGRRRRDAAGPAYASAGELRVIDGVVGLDFERAVYTGVCSESWPMGDVRPCETRLERRRVVLERDGEGSFTPALPFDPDADGPFGPPPPRPSS